MTAAPRTAPRPAFSPLQRNSRSCALRVVPVRARRASHRPVVDREDVEPRADRAHPGRGRCCCCSPLAAAPRLAPTRSTTAAAAPPPSCGPAQPPAAAALGTDPSGYLRHVIGFDNRTCTSRESTSGPRPLSSHQPRSSRPCTFDPCTTRVRLLPTGCEHPGRQPRDARPGRGPRFRRRSDPASLLHPWKAVATASLPPSMVAVAERSRRLGALPRKRRSGVVRAWIALPPSGVACRAHRDRVRPIAAGGGR